MEVTSEQTHILRRAARPEPGADNPLDCFAAVPRGAEEVAAAELTALGINQVAVLRGGVSFVTGKEGLYRATLWLRTASRILLNLSTFPCSSPQELYAGVYAIPWHELITPAMTLAVDCTLRDSVITHSGFAALKTKDAIVDRIRENCGSRPSVDTAAPDVRVNIHLAKNICTVSLDSSGASLDRRGYRLERNDAPLRETLAATIVALTGWDSSVQLADPMCGSGTIPIEAALIATRRAPGRDRPFGFQRWIDYDQFLWNQIFAEAENGIHPLPTGMISGYDLDSNALQMARRNTESAGLAGKIHFFHSALEDFKPEGERGVLIINPPYGKRLGEEEELKELYCRIGDIMKQRCRGWTGFVLTGNLELAKYIGLKASRRFVLFNGAIECRLLKYELY